MSTFPQSPPGRRIASSFCMPNTTYDLWGNLTEFSCMWSMKKYGFFQSKFHSGALTDDFNKNEVAHRAQFYLISFNPSKFGIHPPGIYYTSMDNKKGFAFPFLSISNFITQVVPKFLPSLDAYKTFICKGLFTTTHAIQKGSMISPVEKACLEPLVTWYRSYFERFRFPDRNSVPGSTGIGLALSLRTLFIPIFPNLKKSFGCSTINWVRHFYSNIFSMKYAFSLFLNNRLSCRPTYLNPFLAPLS